MTGIKLPGPLAAFESISGTAISIAIATVIGLMALGWIDHPVTESQAKEMHVAMQSDNMTMLDEQRTYLDRKFKIQEHNTTLGKLDDMIWNVERAIKEDQGNGRDVTSDNTTLRGLKSAHKSVTEKLAACKDPNQICE